MAYYGGLGPDGGPTHPVVKKKAAAPKKTSTKPKTVARPVSQGYDKNLPIKETTPYYGSGQLAYNQYQNVPAPKSKAKAPTQSPQTRTAIANGVQVSGANVHAATKAAKKVAAKHTPAASSTTSGGNGNTPATPATPAAPKAPGSTVGTAPTIKPPAAPAAPKPPATTRSVVVPNYKLDPAYQAQMSALVQGLTDYGATRDQAIKDYGVNYNTTLRNTGYDPVKQTWYGDDPNTQYGAAARSNQEDFGGRGMARSSGYFQSMGNMDNLFNRQLGALSTAKTQYEGQQNQQYNAYSRQNQIMKTQAAIDAAARLAAPLGISGQQVTQNPGRTIKVPISGA